MCLVLGYVLHDIIGNVYVELKEGVFRIDGKITYKDHYCKFPDCTQVSSRKKHGKASDCFFLFSALKPDSGDARNQEAALLPGFLMKGDYYRNPSLLIHQTFASMRCIENSIHPSYLGYYA